jgi:hypothetical protein
VDRHRFDADPDPNVHVDCWCRSDPGRIQNDDDLHANPNPSFTHVGKSESFSLLIGALPIYNILSFSSELKVS